MRLIKRVVEIYDAACVKIGYDARHKAYGLEYRKDGINPWHGQTADCGLALEMYYAHPSALCTPWGKWKFTASFGGEGSSVRNEELMSKLCSALGLSRWIDSDPCHPIFSIRNVDGEALPEPHLAPTAHRCHTLEDVHMAESDWKRFFTASSSIDLDDAPTIGGGIVLPLTQSFSEEV